MRDMETDVFTPDTRTLDTYLTALRSGSPTPGGGSAAAYTGALGSALLAMVCRLTVKSTPSPEIDSIGDELDGIVDALSLSARQDEACYDRYRFAAALPKSTDDEKLIRRTAVQQALLAAARAPLFSAQESIGALRQASAVARLGTTHALSDVDTGVALIAASIKGSLFNVRVNIAMIKDPEIASDLERQASDLENEADDYAHAANNALALRRVPHD